MTQPQVLIVGAGPTGLMLGCQLAINNISFRIIDRTGGHTHRTFDAAGPRERTKKIGW